jgi:hypothetical protein
MDGGPGEEADIADPATVCSLYLHHLQRVDGRRAKENSRGLAERWQKEPETGASFRKGVKFHNGDEFDATDVILFDITDGKARRGTYTKGIDRVRSVIRSPSTSSPPSPSPRSD